jgi:hypothetical protein
VISLEDTGQDGGANLHLTARRRRFVNRPGFAGGSNS